jgi:archaeosine synthase beta-subunit
MMKHIIEHEDFLGPIKNVQDSKCLSASQYYSFIAKFMKHLHSSIPANDYLDFSRPAHIEIRDDFFRGKNTKRAVVFLLSNGCEWALKSAHGCTMCGHIAKQARKDQPISTDDFVKQFETAFSSIDFTGIPVLNIFNNGSFFNDGELPYEARTTILSLIRKNKDIKRLLIESRPEFITESVIQETKSLIPGTEMEIAIGLETTDDIRRSISLNKGFSLRQFTHAADIIRKNNVHLRSYILLKPPFFSEKEAIVDSIRSIETAFSLGVRSVSLEAMTVQKYTLVEYLYNNNLYQMPWLWSIVEVIKRTAHLGKVIIGLFKFYPSPDSVPNNCHLCNHKVMDAIIEYNKTLRTDVFNQLHCKCKEDWKEVLEKSSDYYKNLRDFISVAKNKDSILRSA